MFCFAYGQSSYIFEYHLAVIVGCDKKDTALGALLLATAQNDILVQKIW